jgi:thymidylate synthase
MEAYKTLLRKILKEGQDMAIDRTGAGRKMIPHYTFNHNLRDSFPLLTTKQVSFKNVANELFWFLSGSDSIVPLLEKKCHIWSSDALRFNMDYVVDSGLMTRDEVAQAQLEAKQDANYAPARELIGLYEEALLEDEDFAEQAGKLGPVYGPQWRGMNGAQSIDQISALEDMLQAGGTSTRMLVNAWNPAQLKEMALPPCHYAFSVDIQPESNELNLQWKQRSVDTMLGLPYNLASYALLTHLLAETHDFGVGDVTGFLEHTHIYLPHLPATEEQLAREPLALPTLEVVNKKDSILDYTLEDIELHDYKHQGRLDYPTPMFGGLF